MLRIVIMNMIYIYIIPSIDEEGGLLGVQVHKTTTSMGIR